MNSTVVSPDSIGDNAQVVDVDSLVDVVPESRVSRTSRFSTTDYPSFLDHPLLFYHATLNSASPGVMLTNDIFKRYVTDVSATSLGKKLQNFYTMSCDIKIKVVIQGQPFAGGLWALIAVPVNKCENGLEIVTDNYAIASSAVTNYTFLPHLCVDPSKNSTYELVLPSKNPVGRYSLTGPGFGSYRLFWEPIVPLISGTAATPEMGVCMYVSLENPKPGGLTLLSSAFVEEKKPGGLLSTAAKLAANVAPMVGKSFPALSPFTTIFSSVAGVAGDVLHWFGFSLSRRVDVVTVALNRPNDSYTQMDGTTSAIVLAGTQTNALGLHPGYGVGDGSDMLFSNICSKKGFIESISIPAAAAHGALIHQMLVTPLWTTVAGSEHRFTPIGGVANVFQNWVGDITITFEVVASVFHRATLLIAYDPLNSNPTLAQAVQTLQNTTLVISGNTSVEITVPWSQVYPWGFLGGVVPVGTTVSPGFNPHINGSLYVFVVNPVTSNGGVDGVYMNMYIHSDNIEFQVPRIDTIEPYIPMMELLSSKFIVESASVSFGPKSDLGDVHLRQFGERYKSVKDLTCRLQRKVSYTSVATGSTAKLLRLPNGPGYIAPLGLGVSPTFFDYFSTAYLGYRGSSRNAFYLRHGAEVVPVASHFMLTHKFNQIAAGGLLINTSTDKIESLDLNAYAYTWSAGTVAEGASLLPTTVEFETPSLIGYDFYNTRCTVQGRTDLIELRYPTEMNSGTQLEIGVFLQGSGDDGFFCDFVGFPTLTNG